MTITDSEFANAGARIEAHYNARPDRYPERRQTRIDSLGLARWPTDYYTLRADGFNHEAAIQRVEARMAQAAGELPPAPPPGSGRRGLVRLEGRAFADDAGPWCALGVSEFPLLWLIRHELDRAATRAAWYRARGADFLRAFAEVGGPTWADRTIDPDHPGWEFDIHNAIALASRCGLRLAWTIFAGPSMAHDAAWYPRTTARVCALLAGALPTVQMIEIRNEGEGPDDATTRACAAIVRARLPGVPVALCGTPEAELGRLYAGSAATLATVHYDRRYAERGWRPVRQPWGYYELQDVPTAHVNNEPIGVDSSVAAESDPVRLCAAALTSWVTGEAGYVLHHGAGIRAGGAADLAKGRQADPWEEPALEQALALISGARACLPADLVTWERHGHAWPSHPLDIQSDVGDACEAPGGTGCNRCYAATSGDRAVVVVAGIRGRFLASAKSWPFRVYRPDWMADAPTHLIDLAEDDGALAVLIR